MGDEGLAGGAPGGGEDEDVGRRGERFGAVWGQRVLEGMKGVKVR